MWNWRPDTPTHPGVPRGGGRGGEGGGAAYLATAHLSCPTDQESAPTFLAKPSRLPGMVSEASNLGFGNGFASLHPSLTDP